MGMQASQHPPELAGEVRWVVGDDAGVPGQQRGQDRWPTDLRAVAVGGEQP